VCQFEFTLKLMDASLLSHRRSLGFDGPTKFLLYLEPVCREERGKREEGEGGRREGRKERGGGEGEGKREE
jgi:hypothetical protein